MKYLSSKKWINITIRMNENVHLPFSKLTYDIYERLKDITIDSQKDRNQKKKRKCFLM